MDIVSGMLGAVKKAFAPPERFPYPEMAEVLEGIDDPAILGILTPEGVMFYSTADEEGALAITDAVEAAIREGYLKED